MHALRVVVVERLDAQPVATLLVQDVVADGVDERAETFGALDAVRGADGLDDAEKGLLDHLVDHRAGLAAGAQLDRQQLAEVAGKMLLDGRVGGAQAPQVLCVEGEEFHEPPPH